MPHNVEFKRPPTPPVQEVVIHLSPDEAAALAILIGRTSLAEREKILSSVTPHDKDSISREVVHYFNDKSLETISASIGELYYTLIDGLKD